MRVVALSEPVQNVCNQLKVGLFEILDRNEPWITQRPKHLCEVPALSITHA
jgi:hypothetical protein